MTRMGLENFHKTSWFLSSVNTFMPVSHYHLSSVAQSLSHVWLFVTPMDYSMPGFPVHHQLLELAQTHVHWVGDSIQPSHPLLSPSPAFNLSRIRSFPMSQFFTSGGQSIEASASASVLPMNIWLISYRIDWFNLLAVQGTLKSFLQHHSSKASILQHLAS